MKKITIEEEVKMIPSECTCGKVFAEFEDYEKHWKTHLVKRDVEVVKKLESKIRKELIKNIAENYTDPICDYLNQDFTKPKTQMSYFIKKYLKEKINKVPCCGHSCCCHLERNNL
jgi:hypothetical protein